MGCFDTMLKMEIFSVKLLYLSFLLFKRCTAIDRVGEITLNCNASSIVSWLNFLLSIVLRSE